MINDTTTTTNNNNNNNNENNNDNNDDNDNNSLLDLRGVFGLAVLPRRKYAAASRRSALG